MSPFAEHSLNNEQAVFVIDEVVRHELCMLLWPTLDEYAVAKYLHEHRFAYRRRINEIYGVPRRFGISEISCIWWSAV